MGKHHWFEENEGRHPPVALVGEFSVSLFDFGFQWPEITMRRARTPVFEFKRLPPGSKQIVIFDLIWHGFVIALTSFFCSMIVSRRLSVKKGFQVNPNQEMLGLGLANAGCLTFGAFPCGGILATSVAVLHTPAKTCVWSICCGIIVILLSQIPICTALLAKLPKAVLAAIVVETVIPLISFDAISRISGVFALDLIQYVTTMAFCFLYGIEIGIVAGMVVAVVELVYRGTRNRVSELGRLPDTVRFRKLDNYPEALIADRILICRIYDSLFFTNYFPCEQAIQLLMDDHQSKRKDGEALVGVVINLVSCGSVDSTACFGLLDFSKKYAKKGIAIRFACMTDAVYQSLKRTELEKIHDCGVKYKFYQNDHDAVVDIAQHHHAIHFTGSVHLSEAISPANSKSGSQSH